MTRPILRLNSTGPEVKELQTLLSSQGFKCGTPDGIFGEATRAAVLAFQLKAFGSSDADGVVGPATWARLTGNHTEENSSTTRAGVQILKKGSDIKLSKNFHLSEWACKCSRCSTVKVDFSHVSKLQAFRDRIGKSISINSAYRCPAHNAEVGGVPNSEHVQGCATDIVVSGMSPSAVAQAASSFDGVGTYASFTHVDSRGYQARWNG